MKQEKCPVCGTLGDLTKPDLSVLECHSCKLSWTLIKDEVDQSALYEDEVYSVVDNRESIFEKIIFREAKKVIRTVHLIFNKKEIKCLDFGSGKGQFLYQAKQYGWNTTGVETAIPRAAFAQEKYGLDISTDNYHSGKIREGNYDVICLFHVLEHLNEPMSVVKELTDSNLIENGLLIIEVPNLSSWQRKIAGDKWMHLDIPKHLSHWEENLLTKRIEELGFQKVKSQYFSVHLGVLGMLSSLLIRFGYRGNIIVDLKSKKVKTMIKALIGLPIAWILESAALSFESTGIIRLYFKKV